MIKFLSLTRIAVILIAGVAVRSLAQAWDTVPIASLQTVHGLLQIDQAGEDGYRLFVDSHFIAELEAFSVGISSTLPSDKPQYVLLKIDTGGGSCPALYRLLDLTPGRKPHLTHELGHCFAVPSLKLEGKNIAINFSNSHDSKSQTILYETNLQRLNTFQE